MIEPAASIDTEVQRLLDAMTLQEKASLLSGENFWNTKAVPRLGVPGMMLTDGPHGLRKQGGAADHLGLNKSLPATSFPTAATLANSWDTDLAYRVGVALGREAAAENVSVLLGPGLNLKRSPTGGRNFEYFSEDPYLSGKMAAAMIRGIQSVGVAACPKHFAVNSQELLRMSVDEVVDDRALHELYLEGFRIAVEEGEPLALMTAYNKVNGTYANEHDYLLNQVLRGDWGYRGLVVSDWGGNNDRVQAVRAGSSLEMPSTSGVTDQEVVDAVNSGELLEEDVDARVAEVLRTVLLTQETKADADLDANHDLAIQAAAESAVLLQNDGALPLAPSQRVAVIGDFAGKPRYQGSGSSLVNPTRLTSPLTALELAGVNIVGYAPGFNRAGGTSKRKISDALTLADDADVVLLFLGLDEAAEAEALDRQHMRLDRGQLTLARQLIDLGVPIVVVLAGGAPVELPFAAGVNAILHGYLAGQGGAEALTRVLTGQVNPGGKLAESYPLTYSDTPAAPWYLDSNVTAEHRESIYVGYRYYDKVGAPVLFPFGHGLSYTRFEYSDMQASEKGVRVTVTNTGGRYGDEVVQVYVGPTLSSPDTRAQVFAAEQQLKGFARVGLGPGESRTVTVGFDSHTFAHYDPIQLRWVVPSGVAQVMVGASSRDIRLSEKVAVRGREEDEGLNLDLVATTPPATLPAPYLSGQVHAVSDTDFEDILGRPRPRPTWDPEQPITRQSTILEVTQRGVVGKTLGAVLSGAHHALKLAGQPEVANYTHFLQSLPLRSVSRLSAGMVSENALDGVIAALNGQPVAGLRVALGRDPKAE